MEKIQYQKQHLIFFGNNNNIPNNYLPFFLTNKKPPAVFHKQTKRPGVGEVHVDDLPVGGKLHVLHDHQWSLHTGDGPVVNARVDLAVSALQKKGEAKWERDGHRNGKSSLACLNFECNHTQSHVIWCNMMIYDAISHSSMIQQVFNIHLLETVHASWIWVEPCNRGSPPRHWRQQQTSSGSSWNFIFWSV